MRQTRIVAAVSLCLAFALPQAGSARQTPAASAEALLGQALHQEEVAGDLDAAIATYKKVLADRGASRAITAQALLRLGAAYEKLGQDGARAAYERLAREFGDQTEIAGQARARLATMGRESVSPAAAVVARQLWAGDDFDPFGSLSADGRFYVYVSWTPNNANVAVRDLATGQTRQLTHATTWKDGYAIFPALSADGRRVAYVWDDERGSIRVMDMDGGTPRVLFQQPGIYPSGLRWSPDGRQLSAVVTDFNRSRTHRLVSVNVADGAVSLLKDFGLDSPDSGGYSPDGRWLAYTFDTPSATRRGIYVIPAEGGEERRIVPSEGRDVSPAWSPDGRGIVFVSDRSGAEGLWFQRLQDGTPQGEPELLRPNTGRVINIGFSRDGVYFYATANNRSDVYAGELDPATLELREPLRRITDRFIGSNMGPSWSPDGRAIAFLRGADRRRLSLVIRSLADGSERTLPATFSDTILASGFGATWTADSSALLVPDADYGNGIMRLRRVDVQTGQTQVVLEGSDFWPRVKLSRDGRALYYTRRDDAGNPELKLLRLVRRDLESGREIELYKLASPGVSFFSLAVSPDDREIAFMANDGPERLLLVVPTSGAGPSRLLYKGTYPMPSPAGAAWTADGRHILAMGNPDGSGSRLLAFPVEGGEPRHLPVQMRGMAALDLAPDGRRFAFTGVQSKGELWAISNILPPPAPKAAK